MMLRDELIKAKRNTGLENHYFFSKEIYGNKDMVPHVHAVVSKLFSKWPELNGTSPSYKQLYLLPRGSLKSSVVTCAGSLWEVLRDRNKRALITNETQVKAKSFLRAIKDRVESEDFVELYGDLARNDCWTQYEIELRGRTKIQKEPSIMIGAPGATKTGYHYDLIIADDLVSELTVTTEHQIEKTLDYWRMLQSLLDPGGKIILVGTRYDYDDIYSHVIETGEMDDVLEREAIDDDGNLMWPERFTAGVLKGIEKSLGTYKFNCQYRNKPVSKEDATFRQEQFLRSDEVPSIANRFLLVDPACTTTGTSDYSACIVIHMGLDRKFRILMAEKRKCEPSELIDWMYSLHSYYKFDRIGIEGVAFQRLLANWIQERTNRGDPYLPVFLINRGNRISKETHIRALQPYFENGEFIFCGMFPDLEQELLRFPRLKKDDLADALSMAPIVCYPPTEEVASEDRAEQIRRDEANGLARHYVENKQTGKTSWMKWKY